MIKPGWTHILTLRNGEKRIVLVDRLEKVNHSPNPTAYGQYLVALPRTGWGNPPVVDREYGFMVGHPDAWKPICEGRHSNPDTLLTQTPGELKVGDVRIGSGTGFRLRVLAIDDDRVWVHCPEGQPEYATWGTADFLHLTNPVPTFFEEGHDYEPDGHFGSRITVRHVGEMPNGEQYAVGERRTGAGEGAPTLLTRNDFSKYEDVTR